MIAEPLPTIPDDFDGGDNTCADIHITPDGSAVYVSNRGHDSLAMFSVDAARALSPLGEIATEATPREFDGPSEATRSGSPLHERKANTNALE